MLSKQQIKIIRSLHLKKNRKETGQFVCEGAKIVHELLQSSLFINKIYATSAWISKNINILQNIETIQEISEIELKQLSELSTPNEVLAIVQIPDSEPTLPSGLSLALDSIRDPGNLGTIIRIADWYGLTEIYCSEDCANAYNSKVVQASMGSLFRVKVNYLNLTEFLVSVKAPVYGATLQDSKNLHEVKKLKPGLLVIGNESNGISEEVLALCSEKLHIPRFGKAESLNAAVATGIFLDHFRQ